MTFGKQHMLWLQLFQKPIVIEMRFSITTSAIYVNTHALSCKCVTF